MVQCFTPIDIHFSLYVRFFLVHFCSMFSSVANRSCFRLFIFNVSIHSMGVFPFVETLQLLDEMNNATMCASANHSTCTLDISRKKLRSFDHPHQFSTHSNENWSSIDTKEEEEEKNKLQIKHAFAIINVTKHRKLNLFQEYKLCSMFSQYLFNGCSMFNRFDGCANGSGYFRASNHQQPKKNCYIVKSLNIILFSSFTWKR